MGVQHRSVWLGLKAHQFSLRIVALAHYEYYESSYVSLYNDVSQIVIDQEC